MISQIITGVTIGEKLFKVTKITP